MCEANQHCRKPNTYWIQNMPHPGNVMSCGIHLAGTIKRWRADRLFTGTITVKVRDHNGVWK